MLNGLGDELLQECRHLSRLYQCIFHKNRQFSQYMYSVMLLSSNQQNIPFMTRAALWWMVATVLYMHAILQVISTDVRAGKLKCISVVPLFHVMLSIVGMSHGWNVCYQLAVSNYAMHVFGSLPMIK